MLCTVRWSGAQLTALLLGAFFCVGASCADSEGGSTKQDAGAPGRADADSWNRSFELNACGPDCPALGCSAADVRGRSRACPPGCVCVEADRYGETTCFCPGYCPSRCEEFSWTCGAMKDLTTAREYCLCGPDCDGAQEECIDGTCYCIPSCQERECGDDGCGGTCGDCASGDYCADGKCLCHPECDNTECGTDGCSGVCGECADANDECVDGMCVCKPSCEGKECGDDGCGSPCGDCSDENVCTDDSCGSDGLCEHSVNALQCDDGDLWTCDDICDLGLCLPGAPRQGLEDCPSGDFALYIGGSEANGYCKPTTCYCWTDETKEYEVESSCSDCAGWESWLDQLAENHPCP
jgi:hypothetical protein